MAAEGRALTTRNIRHFIVLAKDAIARQEPCAGIVLCSSTVRGFEIARIVSALPRMVQQHSAGLGLSTSYSPDQGGPNWRNAWRGVWEGGRARCRIECGPWRVSG